MKDAFSQLLGPRQCVNSGDLDVYERPTTGEARTKIRPSTARCRRLKFHPEITIQSPAR